jgi:hypothetical protein
MAKKKQLDLEDSIAASVAGVVVAPPVEEYCTKPRYDEDGVQVTAGILRDGREEVDPVPMSPPVGYVPEPSIMEMIRSMIRDERFRQNLENEEYETFEEADDFDIDDDPLDPLTEYERVFEPKKEPPASPPAAPTVVSTPVASPDHGSTAGSPVRASDTPDNSTPAGKAPIGPQELSK